MDVDATATHRGIMTYEALQLYRGELETQTVSAHTLTISNKQIEKLKGNTKTVTKPNLFGVAKNKNLIIIQVESMQDFVINQKVEGKEITPNLNKLVNNSLYFTNVFQQIGAGNTSDAEFLTNTSLYPPGLQPASRNYVNKELPSLPRLLKKQGYKSMTFHVDDIKYWNRIKLYPAIGFEQYYDDNYFGNDDVIGLGPSDDVLFNKTLKVLEAAHNKKQKFYAHVITLSSHTPFKIPKDKDTLKLSGKYDGTLVGDYITSQHYADEALGRFIAHLKEKGLWDDSVLVVYGDHSGLHMKAGKPIDKKLIDGLIGHSYELADRFNIPLIIHVPGDIHSVKENVGGQVDTMPTVMNLLGIPADAQIHFGHDLINNETNLVGMRYYEPPGTFMNNDVLLVNNNEKGKGNIYNIATKLRVKNVGPYYRSDSKFMQFKNNMLKLLSLSDEYVQTLPTIK